MKVKDLIEILAKLPDQEGKVTIVQVPENDRTGEGVTEYDIRYWVSGLHGITPLRGVIGLVPSYDSVPK